MNLDTKVTSLSVLSVKSQVSGPYAPSLFHLSPFILLLLFEIRERESENYPLNKHLYFVMFHELRCRGSLV